MLKIFYRHDRTWAQSLGIGILANVMSGVLLLAFALEKADSAEPAELLVESSVDIDAPPEVVWREVVAFDELPPPEDWLFSTGIAYPTHASIEGRGVGAVRRCEFSTGAFVEPPHIDSMFRSQRGAFRLYERADGGTRLVGKTWYRQEIWPAAHWRSMSNRIIHRIHMRVLRHIERVAEGAGGS
jgi:hypothetical protein